MTIHYCHKKQYPYLYTESGKPITIETLPDIQQKKEPVENRVSAIIRDIGTCRELVVLESYRLIAKQDEKIQEAYDKKLKELNNAL